MKIQTFVDLLNLGCKIDTHYKFRIGDWFSTIGIMKMKSINDNMEYYYIYPYMEKYTDPEEAVTNFCKQAFTSKNKGYIQLQLEKKGVNFERDYDLEKPSAELIELFKKEGQLIDENYILD